MSEETTAAVSHLQVAMTTDGVNGTEATSVNTMTSGTSSDHRFYFRCALVVVGVVGTAGNALVLYALVAAKQHKKHPMIVNQNALDLFCSLALVVSIAAKLTDVGLNGAVGYWLCVTLYSEAFVSYGMYGSRINIAAVTVERYLKVVHHVWSKSKLRPWMIYSTMAFCWLIGVVFVAFAFKASRIKDGVCFSSLRKQTVVVLTIWYMMSFYVIIFAIFIFCYGRILMVIRRQATVMAAHSAAGPSTAAQTQSNHIQINVIKTMIIVSAFYVVCHLLQAVLYVDMIVGANRLAAVTDARDISRFIQFLYVTANPFIYATKFDPVRKVLKDMFVRCMPHKLVTPRSGALPSRTTAL